MSKAELEKRVEEIDEWKHTTTEAIGSLTVNFTALLHSLIDAKTISRAQFERNRARSRAQIDQLLAEEREKQSTGKDDDA